MTTILICHRFDSTMTRTFWPASNDARMSSLIGMSHLASTSFLTSQIEGLTNGAKQQAGDEEVSKSGKPQQPRQEVDEEDLDNGDYHQVDNTGNLENGEFPAHPVEVQLVVNSPCF